MSSKIIYEFPLNERIRVFIRLEQLFQQFDHFLQGKTVIDKRACLSVLLDIMTIFNRNNIKSEVIKELERHAQILNRVANKSHVDKEKLQELLAEVNTASKKLYAASGKLGINLLKSDLFQSVAQRSTIPGGTCSFDLPEYHYWLEQDEAEQITDLNHWSSPFTDIRDAVDLILDIIRSSSTEQDRVAQAGFFQFSLDSTQPYQLLKVAVDKSVLCFAEISGGKHRCTIRFMVPSGDSSRPVQSTDNIAFALTSCLF
ncbi:MAG: cell division protein ZapD [Methylobacter sp.]|nr:MAG: cell division protein ZapD [Methylobacter sp.]